MDQSQLSNNSSLGASLPDSPSWTRNEAPLLDNREEILLQEFRILVSELDCVKRLQTLNEDAVKPFSPNEWLDDWCLVRYLRARDWNLAKSLAMIEKSIQWRIEYCPHALPLDIVNNILSLSSIYPNGHDRLGRPIIYIKPAAYNPYPWEHRIMGVVYILEYAIRNMPSKVETMVWILDFTGYAQRKQRSEDGAKVAQASLGLLQNHYPERLGAAFIINSPWWLSMFWTLLTPFIATVTRSKIHWLNGDSTSLHLKLSEYVADEQLETRSNSAFHSHYLDYGGYLPVPKITAANLKTNETSM